MTSYVILATLFVVMLSMVYMLFAARWINRQTSGTRRMYMISRCIADGAVSFLRTEYVYISVVAGCISVLLLLLGWYNQPQIPAFRVVNYLVGAGLSGLAGVIGMRVATVSNVRTAQAARTSLVKAFQISFVGGSIMGIGVVAFALLGMVSLMLATLYVVYGNVDVAVLRLADDRIHVLLEVLTGFALGTETIALFARVAGGIYTKAADVGADIVGKVEVGIPEDDPRNPATIADNVGDNVGDIAGMGADLFGSYISTLLAAMVLSVRISVPSYGFYHGTLLLPIAIGGVGLLVSLVMMFFVRLKDEKSSIQAALNIGNIASMVGIAVLCYPVVYGLLPYSRMQMLGSDFVFTPFDLYATILIGIVVSFVVSWVTEYFTSMKYAPVRFIAKQSTTGAATNLIAGLSVGMFSTVLPTLIFAAAIVASYKLASFYGVAITAVSMMSTTAIQLAIDAFGPIADNAGGIAEMSYLPAEVRQRTDALDAVGNTTAAAGKGFAIASAALTALGLFAAFYYALDRRVDVHVFQANVLAGLFMGSIVPLLFSGLIMNSVGKAALQMVDEVRRQFRTISGLMEGKAIPDYQRCISIATKAALHEMLLPGIITLVSPVLVGFVFGAEVLMAFLAGIVVVGTLMALFQCNAGGAWDNAKKLIEKSRDKCMGKGSDAHRAAVVGDTVGDPFKDTSGPAMNILIKVTNIAVLVVVGYL